MPNALCGIEGMAYKTADVAIGERTDYLNIVKEEYTKKYSNAMERAILTFNMVRLLDGTTADKYAGVKALEEVERIKSSAASMTTEYQNSTKSLFTKKATIELFTK
jgi:hypothetical protein